MRPFFDLFFYPQKNLIFFEKTLAFWFPLWYYIKVVRRQELQSGKAVGADGIEGPPVPIPNTEVKLISVENTWLATAWEDRAVPTHLSCGAGKFIYQLLIRILGRGH